MAKLLGSRRCWLLRRRLAFVAAVALVASSCTSSPSPNPKPPTTQPSDSQVSSTETAPSSSSAPSSVESALSADEFQPLNQQVGFGFLRVMSLEERPNPLDVVLYTALPNELPRVAGVITTVQQTPLSHVNLRAIQDKVPNAFIQDADTNPGVRKLIGHYVRYEVTPTGFTLQAATQADVERHHQALRPADVQTPERNLRARTILPLGMMKFSDWTAYGVKAANLATLQTTEMPAVLPDGFAVPFFRYDEFMETQGFYARIRKLLEDPKFRADPVLQETELSRLRKDIRASTLPAEFSAELATARENFPADRSIRCRSSTNNEDLPNFNGAGLYDSKTQRPDEGPLDKCILQVYASVWNLRAFLEREFYRIDHLKTAMGVLLHPNTDDELVNGVAVSIDPVYDTPGAFFVNAQKGEELVTNPNADAAAVPESLLLDQKSKPAFISRSSLITPGTRLLDEATLVALRRSLQAINDRFATLYKVKPGEPFAMEIEFKVRKDGSLYIKQARSWVFS